MKKILTLASMMALSLITTTTAFAQDAAEAEAGAGGLTVLKKYFIDGGAGFMTMILIVLILGLAVCIERIITLSLAETNTNKLLSRVDSALQDNDVDKAKEVCKSTRGPVASVMYQGLDRAKEGLAMVEKSVISYGSVQMGLLEKGLTWISLAISLAPMLGFTGTVIGMIEAFDDIENAGDINIGIVASGIKLALITTLFGLVVAIILQIFYNVIVSKVDGIVNKMEDSSIKLLDMISRYGVTKKD